ncbi:MAG: type II toxin-antitoxin system HicA family toxin [Elusimicrobiota bacterium]
MNRRDFIRDLTAAGCLLHRHGKKHDIYVNPANGRKSSLPRHNELRDSLCKAVRSQLGI